MVPASFCPGACDPFALPGTRGGWAGAQYTGVMPTPAQAAAAYRMDGLVGPTMEEAIGASLPFRATSAFIARALGAGAVDRTVLTEPPLRFLYQNQLQGSRPNLPPPAVGPLVPDTLSPGLDNYLTSLATLAAGCGCSCGGGGGAVMPNPPFPQPLPPPAGGSGSASSSSASGSSSSFFPNPSSGSSSASSSSASSSWDLPYQPMIHVPQQGPRRR